MITYYGIKSISKITIITPLVTRYVDKFFWCIALEDAADFLDLGIVVFKNLSGVHCTLYFATPKVQSTFGFWMINLLVQILKIEVP